MYQAPAPVITDASTLFTSALAFLRVKAAALDQILLRHTPARNLDNARGAADQTVRALALGLAAEDPANQMVLEALASLRAVHRVRAAQAAAAKVHVAHGILGFSA